MRGLLLAMALLPGCATSLGISELVGLRSGETTDTLKRTPIGPVESELEVIPIGVTPLKLVCNLWTRQSRWHERREGQRFGLGWKITGGFFALSQAVFGTLLLANAESKDRGAMIAIGSFLAADAAATTLLLFLLKKRDAAGEREVDGTWVRTRGCPPGVEVEVGDRFVPVDARGNVPREVSPTLIDRIVRVGGSFRVRFDDRLVIISPTLDERCTWAHLNGHPSATQICPMPPPVVVSPTPAPTLAPPKPLAPAMVEPTPPVRVRFKVSIPLIIAPPPR